MTGRLQWLHSYQFFNHGDQRQEILLNGQVEGVLLFQVDRDCNERTVSIICSLSFPSTDFN